ncbi:hypothetical protein Q7689_00355 [Nocardiopsis tropica]|uniref:hypothetical protein n=1 Tax=Nocardiopsis tropica TaxID=109330 RepID=UPI002E87B6E2|nr:hypothetical protein [Nocardiopsis tropica]
MVCSVRPTITISPVDGARVSKIRNASRLLIVLPLETAPDHNAICGVDIDPTIDRI